MAYEAALAETPPTGPLIRTDFDATWVIRFFAGTTETPKPIAHSERGLPSGQSERMLPGPAVDETDVSLAACPARTARTLWCGRSSPAAPRTL